MYNSDRLCSCILTLPVHYCLLLHGFPTQLSDSTFGVCNPSTSPDIQLLPFLFCPEGNGQIAHPKGKHPSPNKVQDDNPQWQIHSNPQHFLQPPQCHHKGTGRNAVPGDSADEGTGPDTPMLRLCSKCLMGKAGP